MTDHISNNTIKEREELLSLSGTYEREEFLSLAGTYIEQSLYQEALRIAESWLKRYPLDADAHIILCHALLKTGNLDRVHEILDNVEKAVLQLSLIYNRVGDLCLSGGLIQEAIKFYGKFIALNPSSPLARNLSEKINTLVPNADGKSTGNDEVVYNNSDNAASDFYTTTVAELYITQGHADMAAAVLSEIIKRDPQNEPVANRLKDVRAMLGGGVRKEKSSPVSHNEVVIQELTRWLNNIDRLKQYAS
jgi:tetratricopeptide (TPR) repeat protein